MNDSEIRAHIARVGGGGGLRFILRCTLYFEGEYPNVCIHALNNVPAPSLLQTCLHPCIGGVAKRMESFAFYLEWSWGE